MSRIWEGKNGTTTDFRIYLPVFITLRNWGFKWQNDILNSYADLKRILKSEIA